MIAPAQQPLQGEVVDQVGQVLTMNAAPQITDRSQPGDAGLSACCWASLGPYRSALPEIDRAKMKEPHQVGR